MESKKEQSENFLDNLPLLRSEDSDQFVPRRSESKPKNKTSPKEDQKDPLKAQEDSKDSFELLNQTTDSQVDNKEPSIKVKKERKVSGILEKIRMNKSEIVGNNEKKSEINGKPPRIQRVNSPLKFEYRMEDLSVFVISVNPPVEDNKADAKDDRKEAGKLCIEKDHLVESELKAYCPKVPQKKKPWTIFGAGIAAFIVFIIIIIKIKRGLKR